MNQMRSEATHIHGQDCAYSVLTTVLLTPFPVWTTNHSCTNIQLCCNCNRNTNQFDARNVRDSLKKWTNFVQKKDLRCNRQCRQWGTILERRILHHCCRGRDQYLENHSECLEYLEQIECFRNTVNGRASVIEAHRQCTHSKRNHHWSPQGIAPNLAYCTCMKGLKCISSLRWGICLSRNCLHHLRLSRDFTKIKMIPDGLAW